MKKCNQVSARDLEVTDKDLATKEQLLELLALYRRETGRLLYVAGQRPDAQQAFKELARGMSSPKKNSLGTSETRHALLGEQTNQLLEVRTDSQRSSRQ